MDESCPEYEWVVSHTLCELYLVKQRSLALVFICVMSQIWMSHVPCINKSCPMYEWIMSHTWMSHVSYKQSFFTYTMQAVPGQVAQPRACVHMCHVKSMCHVTCMNIYVPYVNESCPIWMDYESCVMSHMNGLFHIHNVSCAWSNSAALCLRLYESCPTYEWVMSHVRINHVPYINELFDKHYASGLHHVGKTLQHTAAHRNLLRHTASHCNTLQHTATHCNTL